MLTASISEPRLRAKSAVMTAIQAQNAGAQRDVEVVMSVAPAAGAVCRLVDDAHRGQRVDSPEMVDMAAPKMTRSPSLRGPTGSARSQMVRKM